MKEKNRVVKINVKDMKGIDKFVCLGSMMEKSGKIQNKINERTGMASICYHLAMNL
jgi:hypothetical protein